VFLGPEGSKLNHHRAGRVARACVGDRRLAAGGAWPRALRLGQRSGPADGVTFELLCGWIEESYPSVAPKRLVAEREEGQIAFRYVYFAPADQTEREALPQHAAEVERLVNWVADPTVVFLAMSYRELWDQWSAPGAANWLLEHVKRCASATAWSFQLQAGFGDDASVRDYQGQSHSRACCAWNSTTARALT
jgi:hypothetical protein